MKLTRVTITGADDDVNPQNLINLSRRYPFVEWAFLISPERMGSPRYPTLDWLRLLSEHRIHSMLFAAHFCGRAARETLTGSGEYTSLVPLKMCTRWQLNGYVHITPELRDLARHATQEIILQARSHEAVPSVLADAAELGSSVLIDPSGGRGIDTVEGWNHPAIVGSRPMVGFAGGITPANVMEKLQSIRHEGRFWIDMESGVRNEHDRLDLAKVESVLEQTAPIVGAVR